VGADKGEHLPSHALQAMPSAGAAVFSGVLHLHGRLGDAELGMDGDTDLVLTSAEFGDAYLRNGWASRYLYDVVRTHALVLVGHQAEDRPMRYLLEAPEADRERYPDLKKAYAFAEARDGGDRLQKALWRAEGEASRSSTGSGRTAATPPSTGRCASGAGTRCTP
jgi:SIR2-like protein